MAEKRTDTAPGAAPQAARPTPHPQPADNRPVRRVGSITLGLCLVALGICFLCYYFLPGFNWTLVVKVGAPLALIALGGEVIWCASHQSRWKYDFLAVLGCLVLMGGAFCLALLPIVWENVNPANRMQLQNLSETYEDQLYQALDGQVEPIWKPAMGQRPPKPCRRPAAPASGSGWGFTSTGHTNLPRILPPTAPW